MKHQAKTAGTMRNKARPGGDGQHHIMKSRDAYPGTQLAVTEGFEPSVALATPAFEAGTFGRSDTSP